MPAASLIKSSTPVSTITSIAPSNATTAVQSGPYTKAQFQSTMEGSRTVKNVKEVEQLLRDYPAALELYRTGKYKVKVKYEVDVERVILVEKRTTKGTANNTQENNQTVPDLSTTNEPVKEIKKEQETRQARARTNSQDRLAPISLANGNNIVHATISSIHLTSNTQPKVEHHRTPSKDREASVTPQQKQHAHQRSHSRDSKYKASLNKQQGKQINREYPKMMVPFPANAPNPGNLWQQQQQRPRQPYYSNPVLQQQQQQQQRPNLFMPATFAPRSNALYRPPFFYGQRPVGPVVYKQQQPAYPTSSTVTIGKTRLHSANNYPSSSQSGINTMGLPPSFRTFHSSRQQVAPYRPMYQSQIPFLMNHPWSNVANEPSSALVKTNGAYVEQHRGAKHRARSVDPGARNNPPVRPTNIRQQSPAVIEQYFHHHHHHHRHRPHPSNNVVPSVENGKEQNVPPKEPASVVNGEKLTVRQLNETFIRADPSGRLPFSSIPAILQRFGITLPENDIISAAKELEYNVNEPISARRLVHILVKLGKITKSTQRQPVSPSMLPEDREVTDIMTPRKATAATTDNTNSSNQWN